MSDLKPRNSDSTSQKNQIFTHTTVNCCLKLARMDPQDGQEDKDVTTHHTLWWTYKKQWKMAIEIVDLPMNSMVIFHGKMLVHQRVLVDWVVRIQPIKNMEAHQTPNIGPFRREKSVDTLQ